MPVYSIVITRGVLAANTTLTALTVPAGHTYVIRDIEVIGTNGVANYFTVGLGPPANMLLINIPYAVNTGWGQWSGRCVLNPGDVLAVRTVGPVSANYCLSGYDLT